MREEEVSYYEAPTHPRWGIDSIRLDDRGRVDDLKFIHSI